MSRIVLAAVVAAALAVGLLKRCTPSSHERSIYYQRKGRQDL